MHLRTVPVLHQLPSCTAKGEEKRSCSKCGHTETRTLNALGHSFSKPTVTKKPTCTESGIETGKCTRCGQTTTNTISATGHKWSNWSEKDAATCTEGGSEIRTCSVCKAEEKRNTDALGHDFENPVIVKEPTIASTGLKEGKCKRCGETTSEVIPCSAKDEKTGTSFETKEGVFDAGVELKVEEITKDNPTYESVKSTLKNISEEFRLYDITATLNGEPVQPNGTVNATFTVPEGFGKDTVVFYIAPDGTYEKIDATLGNDGKTISAEISHFSSYAVCKLRDGGGQGGEDGLPKTSDDYIIYAVMAAAAIAAIGGITVVVIAVRKKKAAR